MRCYSHLSDDEREQIGLAKALGHSISAIAQAIGRPNRRSRANSPATGCRAGAIPLHAAGAYQLRRRREALREPRNLRNECPTLRALLRSTGLSWALPPPLSADRLHSALLSPRDAAAAPAPLPGPSPLAARLPRPADTCSAAPLLRRSPLRCRPAFRSSLKSTNCLKPLPLGRCGWHGACGLIQTRYAERTTPPGRVREKDKEPSVARLRIVREAGRQKYAPVRGRHCSRGRRRTDNRS